MNYFDKVIANAQNPRIITYIETAITLNQKQEIKMTLQENDGTELFHTFTTQKQAESEMSAHSYKLRKSGEYSYENVIKHANLLARNLRKNGAFEESSHFLSRYQIA